MLVSILHRATGDGLAVFGLGTLLWWLASLASGPEAYASFIGWMWADVTALQWAAADLIPSLVKVLLKLLLIGLSWAFFNHMSSGIRHFVLDTGAGYELNTNKRFSVVSIVSGVVLTAVFWAAILLN